MGAKLAYSTLLFEDSEDRLDHRLAPCVGGLTSDAHLPRQPRSRIVQHLFRIHKVPNGVALDAAGINRHPPQLHRPLRLRPLQHVRTGVLQRPAVAAPKRPQHPIVCPLAGSQIVKRHILHQAPLQPTRTGNAQRVGVELYLQHQLRNVKFSTFCTISLLKHSHIQTLDHSANEKAKVIRPNASRTLRDE